MVLDVFVALDCVSRIVCSLYSLLQSEILRVASGLNPSAGTHVNVRVLVYAESTASGYSKTLIWKSQVSLKKSIGATHEWHLSEELPEHVKQVSPEIGRASCRERVCLAV